MAEIESMGAMLKIGLLGQYYSSIKPKSYSHKIMRASEKVVYIAFPKPKPPTHEHTFIHYEGGHGGKRSPIINLSVKP
jgi:hypothetical protein